MTKEILYKNTESGKIETIDSSELTGSQINYSNISLELLLQEHASKVYDGTQWQKDDTDNLRYFNPNYNVSALKLGVKFDNLPIDVDTIHLELLRYKKAKNKYYNMPVSSDTTMVYKPVPAGWKSFRNTRNTHMIYGVNPDTFKVFEMGSARNLRPTIFEVQKQNGLQVFDFGAEYYFKASWNDSEEAYNPLDYSDVIDLDVATSVAGFPLAKGYFMRKTSTTKYFNNLTIENLRLTAKAGNNAIDNVEFSLSGGDVYFNGYRRRSRVRMAVRLIFNKDQENEIVTPILLQFNLVGLKYRFLSLDDFAHQEGVVKIIPLGT